MKHEQPQWDYLTTYFKTTAPLFLSKRDSAGCRVCRTRPDAGAGDRRSAFARQRADGFAGRGAAGRTTYAAASIRLGLRVALDQRIAVRYSLAGLEPADSAEHPSPLRDRGRSDTLFSDHAVSLIHNAARRYPRVVNNLAGHALTSAKSAIVEEKSARIAVTESCHERVIHFATSLCGGCRHRA